MTPNKPMTREEVIVELKDRLEHEVNSIKLLKNNEAETQAIEDCEKEALLLTSVLTLLQNQPISEEEIEKIVSDIHYSFIGTGKSHGEFYKAVASALSRLALPKVDRKLTIPEKWEDRVCSYCGGKLEKKKVDEQDTIVCMPCSRIEYGTSQEIFGIADDMVRLKHFHYFGCDIIEDEEQRTKSDVSHYAHIIHYIITYLDGKDTPNS